MKKVLLFILFMGFLFCITGCGEEDPMDDPFVQELEEYSFKDHLQCTKSEGKISYKIDVFQDPETYEVVFGALTETYDIYPYDNQGNFTGFDPEKEYCSDYEKDAFSKCKSLTSIVISKGVKKIDSAAFYGCNNLTSITIPNSVKSIEDCLFLGCEAITNIKITIFFSMFIFSFIN